MERLPVLVSYNGISKLLGAPKIKTSSGSSISAAVHDLLIKWDIADRVSAVGFDTTASNTGVDNGACVLLEQLLNRKLVQLACRHHIYELNLRAVFDLKLSTSSAPEVLIFKRFATSWPNMDHKNFRSGLEDDIISSKIPQDVQNDVKRYCTHRLTEPHSRNDYKELLQLALIFLGMENDGNFRAPGAISHARWMSKSIYSLKIFLFRDQFHLTNRELNGLRDICIFLIRMYIKAWFGCTQAIAAPNQDYQFILDTIGYAEVDKQVSEAILKKMSNHLWYLSKETIALALFDPAVSIDEKKRMIYRMNFSEPLVVVINNRKLMNPKLLLQHNLADFVSKETEFFFKRFELSPAFLQLDPSEWDTNADYQRAQSFCADLFVVNDTAERGVKFMKDYNRVLTTNEEENQLLLQIVESYRKKYPSHNKLSLIS